MNQPRFVVRGCFKSIRGFITATTPLIVHLRELRIHNPDRRVLLV